MKKYFYLFILVFLSFQFSFATTYFKSWVNGIESNTLTQGDFYAWEYDLSVAGGSANVKIIVDANANQLFDEGDIVLIAFTQTDGELEGDGPSDSSAVPDGRIYTILGPFGFAPADYLFEVTDLNDQSKVIGILHINPMPNVTVWVKGNLSIEGITPPDARLANFMFEASDENEEFGILSGLTDENGDFTINLPDDAVGNSFKIGYMFESQYSGYDPQPISYHNVTIQSGQNGPFTFNLNHPMALIYGQVLDENDQLVPVSGWGSIENLSTYDELEFNVFEGSYKSAVPFGSGDTTDVTFQLHFWSEELVPQYLIPVFWNNPDYSFVMSKGDSLEKNIRVFKTDTVIYVMAQMDGNPLPEKYETWASNDMVGQSYSTFSGQYLTTIPVRRGYQYGVRLVNTDYGELEVPPGYFLDGGNWREAWPGDTVRFRLLPSQGMITGHLSFDAGDPQDGNLESCQVQAFADNWTKWYDGNIDWDSLKYAISVPNDTFDVRFRCWDWDYLAFPDIYENIVVQDGQVDNINFILNYTHATIEVHLKNAHLQELGQLYHHISTLGIYPNVYVSEAQLQSDTSFYFKVCEGNWVINAPYLGNGYVPDNDQVTVSVSEDSSFYFVEFNYHLDTGIKNEATIPRQFFVKQNYPNPFNPVTTIEFGLPKNELVTVNIYNLNGQKVSQLFKGSLPAGVHKLQWNGQQFASGIYFFQILTENKNVIKRMILIK